MQWNTDLPDEWEDAPRNPPEVQTSGETELVVLDGDEGAILRPTEGGIPRDVEGTRMSHALHSERVVGLPEADEEPVEVGADAETPDA